MDHSIYIYLIAAGQLFADSTPAGQAIELPQRCANAWRDFVMKACGHTAQMKR